jgi:hypothetical protein
MQKASGVLCGRQWRKERGEGEIWPMHATSSAHLPLLEKSEARFLSKICNKNAENHLSSSRKYKCLSFLIKMN